MGTRGLGFQSASLHPKPLEDPLAHLPCSTILECRKGELIYSQDQPSTMQCRHFGSVRLRRLHRPAEEASDHDQHEPERKSVMVIVECASPGSSFAPPGKR